METVKRWVIKDKWGNWLFETNSETESNAWLRLGRKFKWNITSLDIERFWGDIYKRSGYSAVVLEIHELPNHQNT